MYVDTSVLAAYYCPEQLSLKAEKILRHVRPAISDLTEVEFMSTISRKTRMGELTHGAARKITTLFLSQVQGGFFERFSITRVHYQKAMDWLRLGKIGLKTLDALHLAIASTEKVSLLTADKALARSAVKIRAKVKSL